MTSKNYIEPSPGHIVQYVLTEQDVLRIRNERTSRYQFGLPIEGYVPMAGDVLPLLVTHLGDDSINGQVFLDCDGLLWVWAVRHNNDTFVTGTWSWPVRRIEA